MTSKNNEWNINFIGIGAEKAGTSWLFDCLSEHPEVCIPKEKELYFFNEYDPHFLEVENDKYQRGLIFYKSFFKKMFARKY